MSVYTTSDASNAVTDATGSVVFLNDGTGQIRVDITPTVTGDNKLNVLINGEHISGSPFSINSIAWLGTVRGSASTATGTGLSAGTAGVQGSFVVQARDINGNERTSGGDTFTVVLAMTTLSTRPVALDTMNPGTTLASDVIGSCTYDVDGRYNCIYNATVSGTYALSVVEQSTTPPENIVGSPFNAYIAPGESARRRFYGISTSKPDIFRTEPY